MELNNNSIQEGQLNTLILVSKKDLKDFAVSIIDEVKSNLQNEIKEIDQEEFLNTRQTLKLLNISQSSLNRWVKAGYIKPYVIGGRNKFSRNEIKKLIASSR